MSMDQITLIVVTVLLIPVYMIVLSAASTIGKVWALRMLFQDKQEEKENCYNENKAVN